MSPVDPDARSLKEGYRPDYREVIGAIRKFEGKLPATGLSLEENRELAMAVDIQILIPLLLRGLRTIVR